MARIPDEVVAQLKAEVSLLSLIETPGITLKRHGADWSGLCTFHDDHAPSLVVSPEKNLWHCLGACQAGGSVIDWVMKAEGVSFRHAVDLLQNDYRPLVAHGRRPKQATVRKLTALAVFVYDGGPATTVPHLSGLIDVTTLKSNCDAERAGVVILRKMTITPLPMRSYRRSITRCSSMHIPGNTANLIVWTAALFAAAE